MPESSKFWQMGRAGYSIARFQCLLLAELAMLFVGMIAYNIYKFKKIFIGDGLSQSSVQAMVQGPNDYLWIGTQYGLDRYDGYAVKHWTAGGDAEALSHGFVRELMLDRGGMLWIGASDGLNRLDPDSGRVTRYFPPGLDRAGVSFSVSRAGLVEDA